jgi:hypothetical protein
MWSLLPLLLAIATDPPTVESDPRAAAAALEEQAFAAVDKEEWCRAARLFEQANARAPAAGLLVNAAHAAEFGGDLGSARTFLQSVSQATTATKTQRADARAKLVELDRRIVKSGIGTPCPALPTTASAVVVDPPVKPGPDPSTASPAAARTTGAWALGGVGGGLVALGGVAAGLGLQPWFEHAATKDAIAAAERRLADASGLQAQQGRARAAWESWGQALTVAGGIGVGLGVLAVGAGVGWAVLSSSTSPE